MLQVSLYRYNPETDEAPYMQDFSVDTGGRDLMVLDVLELIKADHDGSVTYRRSCREGVCGSDGLNMNGKNGLACITPLSETVKGEKLVIRPLPGLPVIRDLVVDTLIVEGKCVNRRFDPATGGECTRDDWQRFLGSPDDE